MTLLRSAQVPRVVDGPAGCGSCWPSSLTQTTSSQGLSVGLLPTGDTGNPVREVSLWKEPVETRVGSLVSESPTRLSMACSALVTARSPGPRTVTGTLTKTHRIAVSLAVNRSPAPCRAGLPVPYPRHPQGWRRYLCPGGQWNISEVTRQTAQRGSHGGKRPAHVAAMMAGTDISALEPWYRPPAGTLALQVVVLQPSDLPKHAGGDSPETRGHTGLTGVQVPGESPFLAWRRGARRWCPPSPRRSRFAMCPRRLQYCTADTTSRNVPWARQAP